MNTTQRLNYDLSVLVNKYDSYLKWAEQQKVLEAENLNTQQNSCSEINRYAKSISYISSNNTTSQSDDISNLVDDIFDI
jgi:predicted double-glycine peptidase